MIPADIIVALEETSSTKEKEAIIEQAWQQGIIQFFDGAKYTFDSLITFGVKKIPFIEDEVNSPPIGSYTWIEFCSLLDQLAARSLTGNAAKTAVRRAAERSSTYEWNNWYRRILQKDFKAGVSSVTINKVLKKIGKSAEQKIIPVFSCQLAKDGSDHAKKIVGKKLLQCKLDGTRLLTVMNKEDNRVQQFSRNGILNENFQHICDNLSKILPLLSESVVLDGELISDNFQSLMKQFRRKQNVDTSDAYYAIFDIIPLKKFTQGEYELPQKDRHLALCQLDSILRTATDNRVYVLPLIDVDLDTEEGTNKLKDFNNEALLANYEGILIKDPFAPYKCNRTDAWLKIKPVLTVDLEVVDAEIGKPDGKHSKTLGNLLCKGEYEGRKISVSVGSGFSDDLRDQIWEQKDRVIGMIVEIEADCLTLSEDSEIYSLRFPRFVRFRGWSPCEKI